MEPKKVLKKINPVTVALIILIIGLIVTLFIFIFFVDNSSASDNKEFIERPGHCALTSP